VEGQRLSLSKGFEYPFPILLLNANAIINHADLTPTILSTSFNIELPTG